MVAAGSLRAAAALVMMAAGGVPGRADDAPTPTPPAAPAPAAKPPTPAPTAQDRQDVARVDRYISELHRRLRITAAEQPQWDVFAQTMRDNALHMDQLFRARSAAETMNAVEDLKSYAGIAEAHAEDMQRLVPAFETLYSAMSPEQQRLADTAFKQFEARGMRRSPHG
jgi:hypothetical protein